MRKDEESVREVQYSTVQCDRKDEESVREVQYSAIQYNTGLHSKMWQRLLDIPRNSPASHS